MDKRVYEKSKNDYSIIKKKIKTLDYCLEYYLIAFGQQKLFDYNFIIMKSQIDQALQKYNYQKDKPYFTANNYSVWNGQQIQSNINVTIKLIKFPHIELLKYLKKMKDVKSEFIIKIFEVIIDPSALLFITQQVTYGTLKKALSACEHLDENDSVFVGRSLLNGHVDLLRADCNWFGTEDDIQFTDSGIKLSWNNSCAFNLVNPFPALLAKLANRNQINKGTSLLPFPQIKILNDLIKVCKENASEISLHPQMKQKIKFSKKKGKNWMGLRQVKNKNEYFDELVYLGISKQYGFVRAKIYEIGKISPNLLQYNKTKNTFTKVLQTYDQGDKTIILSSYANDGNLQNYVKRLKGSAITLKQQHIQFFFYSLFEPLKSIQQSTLKSMNMLHIKNIYIQNGIPKIGEPIPLNSKINQILIDRSDVPDFYHSGFKKDPASHSVNYDTYSLGVLLYKLMYTQYPIFPPEGVHIPTTPNYNPRLKTSLKILLNQGGSLAELQKRIEVSEEVLKQVKVNKEKLMEGFGQKREKKVVVKRQSDDQEQQQDKPQTLSKISIMQEQRKQDDVSQSQSDDQDGCVNMFLSKLKLKPAQKVKDPSIFIQKLQQSPYKRCRLWTKAIFALLLYIFMFYYNFLSNNVAFLANQNLLQKNKMTIDSTDYYITSTNFYQFQTELSKTLGGLSDITNMGCLIDDYQGGPTYSKVAFNGSTPWLVFVLASILSFILLLVFKIIQINTFDGIKALFLRQNGKGKFNMANYIILNLFFGGLVSGHFFLFNFVFYGQTEPCLGFNDGVQYGSSDALFNLNLNSDFTDIFMAVFISQILLTIIYMIVIALNQTINYNKVLNPITIFGGALLIFTLIVRFGAIFTNSYYPSAANDPQNIIKGMFDRGDLVGIIGILPEILFALQILIFLLVDWAYWGLIDNSNSLLANDASIANDGLNEIV